MMPGWGPDIVIGPFSAHMLQHVAVMNVAMPLLAFSLSVRGPSHLWRSWPLATFCQLALLWGWHSPPTFALAMSKPVVMAAMHVSLALAALWFWAAIASIPATGRWRAIFALLITGKLFCLLGALLVFSPRHLFPSILAAHAGHAGPTGTMLGDQQLAGLIMLTACPLTYVLAGIVISARWFLSLERQAAADG